MPTKKNTTPGRAHCIYLPCELNKKSLKYLKKRKITMSALVQLALNNLLNEGSIDAKKAVPERTQIF